MLKGCNLCIEWWFDKNQLSWLY